MPVFYKVQFVRTLDQCFLTPIQCFVDWQGKANLPNSEHALLAQSPTSTNPESMLLDSTSMLCSAAWEKLLAHSQHALLPQSPICTKLKSILLDRTSMLCSVARESTLADFEQAHLPQSPGEGEEKKFRYRVGYFFSGVTPPRGVGYEKKWVLQKKNFLPMSHVPHIITVFPPHNMPLLLVGIPLCGYFGY